MSKRSRRRSLMSGAQQERLNLMTPKTKDFIQKICYKKTASIDMTKHGFITESRMGPINAYIKPLREQIQKIIEASKNTEDNTIIRNRRSIISAAPFPATQPSFSFQKEKIQRKSVVFSL